MENLNHPIKLLISEDLIAYFTIVPRSGNRFDKRRDICPGIWYVPSNT
jgi:hypothetical protein